MKRCAWAAFAVRAKARRLGRSEHHASEAADQLGARQPRMQGVVSVRVDDPIVDANVPFMHQLAHGDRFLELVEERCQEFVRIGSRLGAL